MIEHIYTVLEHDYLAPEGCWTEVPERVTVLPGDFFAWLLARTEKELDKHLKPVIYKRQSVLKAQNHVGLIQAPSGEQLEVLPKVTDLGHEDAIAQGRQMLLRMLSALPDFSQIGLPWQASVQRTHWPLWTQWITQMLEAVAQVVRHGLRSAYSETEGQQNVLRGRLLVAEQVRHNTVHRERLYCRHSLYSQNRAENRLLRLLLERIGRQSLRPEQRQQVRQLLLHFEGIPASRDWQQDRRAVRLERGMGSYQTALHWLYWLMERQMPLTSAGRDAGWSLLLDMDVLFEKFVCQHLGKTLPKGWQLREQVNEKHLLQCGNVPLQKLKPDLLLKRPDGSVAAILDAKWKRMETANPLHVQAKEKDRHKVDRNDLYQMQAYATAYLPAGGDVFLIYPQTAKFVRPSGWARFEHVPQCRIQAMPFDVHADGRGEESLTWWADLLQALAREGRAAAQGSVA